MDDMQPDNTMPMGQEDHEGAMAKADLYKLANYSFKLFKKIEPDAQLEGWVQAKITKAADYIASVYHYMEYEMKFSQYGQALDNSDVLSESEKAELKNKLMEAKSAMASLKKQQAERIKESELKKTGDSKKTATGVLTKTATGVKHERTDYSDEERGEVQDTHAKSKSAAEKKAEAPKLKKSKSGTWGMEGGEKFDTRKKEKKVNEVSSDTLKSYYSKAGEKIIGHIKSGDYADDKNADRKLDNRLKGSERADARLDKRKRTEKAELDEAKKSPKAKKDYDKDGKVETEKEEVIGSRRKAAGLDEAHTCNETHKGTSCPVHGLKECPMEEGAKPSAGMTKKEKSAVVKKAKAGEDIGKPGKGFAKVEKAAKKGGAKDPKAVAAAAMWKNVKEAVAVAEAAKKAKPDFADLDKDGDKKEPMKKAAKEKETVNESADLNRVKQFLNRLIG